VIPDSEGRKALPLIESPTNRKWMEMDEQEINAAKEIITDLAKQMDSLTGLKTIMTDDECLANQAYKMIDEAIMYISDAIGISEAEMEKLTDTRG